MEQLCLNLGEVPFQHGGRKVRPVPEIVSELFEVNDAVPSGIVWKVNPQGSKACAGEMAGCLLNGTGNKYLVYVRGHGQHYTHRIAYYLKTLSNPGSMVVRHLADGGLGVGWQSDNGRDVKGSFKKADSGYTTRVMYCYQGRRYNLRRLCEELQLSYPSIYQKLYRTKATYEQVFEAHGIKGVTRELNTD